MKPLTKKQLNIFEFITEFSGTNGYPPTLREISKGPGPMNISAVRGHIKALEKKGYIAREEEKARSIQILNYPEGSQSPSKISKFKKILHKIVHTDDGVRHHVVYAIVLATRERRRSLVGVAGQRMTDALQKQAIEHGWDILEHRMEPDYMAFIVKAWPTHSPHNVAHRVRHACNAIKRKYPSDYPGKHLWTKGFGCTTKIDNFEDLIDEFVDSVPVKG